MVQKRYTVVRAGKPSDSSPNDSDVLSFKSVRGTACTSSIFSIRRTFARRATEFTVIAPVDAYSQVSSNVMQSEVIYDRAV